MLSARSYFVVHLTGSFKRRVRLIKWFEYNIRGLVVRDEWLICATEQEHQRLVEYLKERDAWFENLGKYEREEKGE